MGQVQPVIQLGHPTLRKTAKFVDAIASSETESLIANLFATSSSLGGMGIAAPQINVSRQVFVMTSKPNARYPNAPEFEPTAIINPKIIRGWGRKSLDWEGCLSVPGLRGKVPRYEHIQVTYHTPDCIKIEKEFSGFLARVFQHEFDHLIGKLFIDHVDVSTDLWTEASWQAAIKDGTLS